MLADGVALSEGRELAGGGREWRWGVCVQDERGVGEALGCER